MRVHRLTVQAFGPFAAQESVDFDTLSEAGLFLLHGPTGAGKTSVLDAVCFALYGRIPGVRSTLSRLRSDHAAAQVAPQVVCEFSVGARRFEVTRSPAWERAKRRGTGSTTEQARVALRELRGGVWEPLSTRIDEAAHLLDDVLGLGPEEFTKLVLLPQGEFASFLRADADTRRQLLERIFGTDRFAAVQAWLRERRAQLREEVGAARELTERLLARAEQALASIPRPAALPPAGGPQLPAPTAPTAPTGPAEDNAGPATRTDAVIDVGAVRERLRGMRLDAAHAWEDALAQRAAAQARLNKVVAEHERARSLLQRRQELGELTARHTQLLSDAAQRQANRIRLADAERASALVPLAGPLRAARGRWERAVTALERCERPGIEDHMIDAELTAAREGLGEVAAIEQDAAALDALLAETGRLTQASTSARATLTQARAGLDHTRGELALLVTQRHELLARAQTRAGAQTDLARARTVAEAVTERDRLALQLERLGAAQASAEHARNGAMRGWLDLRERRLSGIAAELAGHLEEGAPCRVCGATEHPTPAVSEAGAVTAEEERAAHRAYERAERSFAAVEGELSDVRQRAATARAVAAGLDSAAAGAALTRAQDAVREAELAAARIPQLTLELDAAQGRLHTWEEACADAEEQSAMTEAAATRAAERVRGLDERVQRVRGEDASIQARRVRLVSEIDVLEHLLAARNVVRITRDQLRETRDAALAAADAAGFDDLDGAIGAVLDPGRRAALEHASHEYDAEFAALVSRLASPELVEAAQSTDPPLAALSAQLELARTDDDAAAGAVALCESAAHALDGIAQDAQRHLLACLPTLATFRRVDELARCLDGTGGENARRMTLSAYVLAARLEQVAEAASVRLERMSGGRYTLAHTEDADRARGRAGLSLQVVDGWTGQRRETASLSGGESFYASLALALGLADVVCAEAGGTTIETLFVDEGFGSLDEEALEEVMDTLDGLRSGGRVVGLVSHLPDLRERIPARLEVIKTRSGSRLHQVGPAEGGLEQDSVVA